MLAGLRLEASKNASSDKKTESFPWQPAWRILALRFAPGLTDENLQL